MANEKCGECGALMACLDGSGSLYASHETNGCLCLSNQRAKLGGEIIRLRAGNKQLQAELAWLKRYLRDIQPADRAVCHECEMPLMPDGLCMCTWAVRKARKDAEEKPHE